MQQLQTATITEIERIIAALEGLWICTGVIPEETKQEIAAIQEEIVNYYYDSYQEKHQERLQKMKAREQEQDLPF